MSNLFDVAFILLVALAFIPGLGCVIAEWRMISVRRRLRDDSSEWVSHYEGAGDTVIGFVEVGGRVAGVPSIGGPWMVAVVGRDALIVESQYPWPFAPRAQVILNEEGSLGRRAGYIVDRSKKVAIRSRPPTKLWDLLARGGWQVAIDVRS